MKYVPFLLIIATAVSSVAFYVDEVYGFIVVAGVLLLLYCALFPTFVAWFGLMSLAISPQSVGGGVVTSYDVASAHKAAVFLCLLPFAFTHGVRERVNEPLAAYALIVVISYTFASWYPSLESSQPLRAFVSFAIGWFIFSLNWDKRRLEIYLASLATLPPLSLVVGALLDILNVHDMYVVEYTGALRVQGATIAPHLAMLAFVGTASALTLAVRGRPWGLLLACTDVVVLAATGTRGALVATLLLVLGYVVIKGRNALRSGGTPALSLLTLAVVLVVTVYLALPNLERRTLDSPIDPGINSSGRVTAWQFFFDEATENTWFGRGLGADTLGRGITTLDGTIPETFASTHNEYLRIFVASGVVGTAAFIAAFVLLFRRILRRLDSETKLLLGIVAICFALYSFFDNTLATPQFLYPFCWYLALLCVPSAREAIWGSADGQVSRVEQGTRTSRGETLTSKNLLSTRGSSPSE